MWPFSKGASKPKAESDDHFGGLSIKKKIEPKK